jgi:AbrB family looped-hinge helix DNA binding protein
MATATKPIPARSFPAKITSKGQITIPVEIRRSLGVRTGDKIRFVEQESGIGVVRDTDENPFEKWRGIGGFPGMGKGRDGVLAYMREVRGYDEYDDSLA